MNREALEKVIVKYLNSIKNHSDRLPGSFDHEDIHDLRVDYKKARAFLRLLQLEKDAGDLGMPAKLRSLYHHCGKVRDLQLFLIELQALPVAAFLPVCISQWKQQLFTYKEETVRAIEAMDFKKIRNTLLKKLPRQLQEQTIIQFAHEKIAAVHIVLLAADHEDDLHTTRKQIKDLIYNIRIFEGDWGIPFPVSGWKSEKSLSNMASRLGDFNDRCIALSLLQSGYSANCHEKEKLALQELQAGWQQNKETRQQQLLQQVHLLQLEHRF
ncbi:CHAD domain-containing protein [Longitalea arenae]|uniref:CHAD domain-containing protein n=1 Tax=Longitalea arenae TaxID=2812558 RepID=UPI0019677BEA|nr:CHAD domain-containing protein [Longitalea arenae]